MAMSKRYPTRCSLVWSYPRYRATLGHAQTIFVEAVPHGVVVAVHRYPFPFITYSSKLLGPIPRISR